MYIYKITCIVNGKIYIGQAKNVKARFSRHVHDAYSNRLNTHFARAIRKYGYNNFICEVIDSSEDQDDLNRKEVYWIHYYNSIDNGYNETDSINRSGGNTYKSKTAEEMQGIKNKLSLANLGENNGMARPIKCRNIYTGEELHFDTVISCVTYFELISKNPIAFRLSGRVKSLFHDCWEVAYEDDNYATFYERHKRGQELIVYNVRTNEKEHFWSIRSLAEAYGINRKDIQDGYKFEYFGNEYIVKFNK